MRILLVGGAVRNMLLGLPARDRDYLVLDATVEDFLAAHPTAKPVGKTFPVFILDHQEYSFGRAQTLEQDLTLRDFTINAMAMDDTGRLFCHPTALEDLQARVLRPASASSLSDDPLRAIRAARFCAQMPGLSAHPELLASMRGVAASGALAEPYAERVGQEVQKALAGERPGEFLRLLDRTGCLLPWLAELDGASAIPAGPPQYHDASVLEHTARVMDRLAGDAMSVWMALCHDLGKVTTPADILPRHYGHDQRGEELAMALGQRLRLPTRLINAGADAARWHMVAGNYPELKASTRVDLLTRLKSRGVLREMFRLELADKNRDHGAQVQADLAAILAVKLPPEDRDQGERSAEKLRALRITSLLHAAPRA
ncbi:MAG TPA: HD domain-containing protein [Humidesulfovibrio sp.]|uniref:HD domain-containing protein n=1 Tax=Humidesulfovibrio sp. TaxID=2910988 RepID=UPI002C71A2FB|nr:HD domain-containing protein [Humidesulfovibrio sp.]HWR04329.1 HD domain-containing protein [Humidesulfovibrio sp.]